MSKSIEQKVASHVAQFKIGDSIECLVDGVEMDGVILSIEKNHAKMATAWGNVTAWLPIAKKTK